MIDDGGQDEERDAIRRLITSWTKTPAFLCDRYFTVLASNRLAQSLTPAYCEGANLASFTFLEPDVDREHELYPEASRQTVALLRDSLDEHDGDSSFRTIVGNLSVHSDDFATAWADDSLLAIGRGEVAFPDIAQGSIRLTYQLLRLTGDSGDTLFVWSPADPEAAAALDRLAETTEPPVDRDHPN
jgi:hypothetical protein